MDEPIVGGVSREDFVAELEGMRKAEVIDRAWDQRVELIAGANREHGLATALEHATDAGRNARIMFLSGLGSDAATWAAVNALFEVMPGTVVNERSLAVRESWRPWMAYALGAAATASFGCSPADLMRPVEETREELAALRGAAADLEESHAQLAESVDAAMYGEAPALPADHPLQVRLTELEGQLQAMDQVAAGLREAHAHEVARRAALERVLAARDMEDVEPVVETDPAGAGLPPREVDAGAAEHPDHLTEHDPAL